MTRTAAIPPETLNAIVDAVGVRVAAAEQRGRAFVLSMRADITAARAKASDALAVVERQTGHAPPPRDVVTLTDVGQGVSIRPSHAQKPEQVGVAFAIAQVVGDGADAFVSLLAPDGTIAEWFRADELQPASVSPHAPPPVSTGRPIGKPLKGAKLASRKNTAIGRSAAPPTTEETAAAADLLASAQQLATAEHISLRDAVRRVSTANPSAVALYRAAMDSGLRDRLVAYNPADVVSLAASLQAEETAFETASCTLTARTLSIAAEKDIRLSDALTLACAEDPTSAATYYAGRNRGRQG